MNFNLKSATFSLAGSLLIAIGANIPVQAHSSFNNHGHGTGSSYSIPATQLKSSLEVQGNSQSPVILPDVNRPGFWLFSDNAEFVETGNNTNSLLSLFDFTTLPGGPIPHSHTLEDEFVYVLEGEISYQVEDTVFTAVPGDFIPKPKDILHAFINAGDTPARHLEFVLPSGIGDFFSQFGIPGSADNPPPLLEPTPELLDSTFDAFTQFGLIAPDSLLFSPAQYGPKDGTPGITVFRPGENQGEVGATITVTDPDENIVAEIPVTFADGGRIETLTIPGLAPGDYELFLKDPTNGASIALLQNKALLSVVDDQTYTVLDGYDPDDFPFLEPDSQLESFLLGGNIYNSIAKETNTKGLLSIFEVLLPQQSQLQSPLTEVLKAPTDLALYTLDGSINLGVGDNSFVVDPNTFIYLPTGSEYSLSNLADPSSINLLTGSEYALSNSADPSSRLLVFSATDPVALETFVAENGVPIPEGQHFFLSYGILLVIGIFGGWKRKNR